MSHFNRIILADLGSTKPYELDHHSPIATQTQLITTIAAEALRTGSTISLSMEILLPPGELPAPHSKTMQLAHSQLQEVRDRLIAEGVSTEKITAHVL
ncbi:MAG: hypothetical protein HOW73_24225 [Polyangiaceae bacterium]|nr:hypothetical protein [Polyangiaceae bacterium]